MNDQPKDSAQKPQYISALRYDALTSLYDPILRWTLRESTFRDALVRQTHIASRDRVLDLGCGTATLTLQLKRAYPEAEIIGLDGDAKVLQIAERKVAVAGMVIPLVQSLVTSLPYADASFDYVVSSLLMHHLTHQDKVQMLHEVFRVLWPGGELHIADWGKAQNGLLRAAFLLIQLLDGFATTAENVQCAWWTTSIVHSSRFHGSPANSAVRHRVWNTEVVRCTQASPSNPTIT